MTKELKLAVLLALIPVTVLALAYCYKTNMKTLNHPTPKRKTYEIDIRNQTDAADNGRPALFTEKWRYVGQIIASRCASALRQSERAYPGRMIRARLVINWAGAEHDEPCAMCEAKKLLREVAR